MSGLETLSLVANIFQVIGFACETVGLCKSIYRGQLPDAVLVKYGDSLESLSTTIQAQCNKTTPKSRDEKSLSDIAAKCNVAARALVDEAKFLTSHQAKGSLIATLKLVSKTKWRQRRLERLEKSLDDYEKILRTQLLVRICTQSHAAELRQREDFRRLDKSLQQFIAQWANGHLELSKLVETEMASLKRHTTSLSEKVQDSVNSHTTLQTDQMKQSIIDHVAKSQRSVTRHTTLEVDRVQNDISTHLQTQLGGAVEQITHGIESLNTKTIDDGRKERLLRSLKYPGMNARRNQAATSHVRTFGWILDIGDDNTTDADSSDGDDDSEDINYERDEFWEDHYVRSDNFLEWLQSDNDLYWISGKPGSGKSTLVKFLVNHPATRSALESWRPNTIILSHFLWKLGSEMQSNVKGLLCSLLHQALSSITDHVTLTSILSAFPFLASKDEHTDWSLEDLMAVSSALFSSSPSHFCVFIDGLDEVCDKEGADLLMEAVGNLRRTGNIKLCVSSRPEPRFARRLANEQHLRLQDLTAADMHRYAHAKLKPYLPTLAQQTYKDRSHSVQSLVEKADGVFLWLHLAIRSLIRGMENCDSKEELSRRLDSLPRELSTLYSDMWMRLNEDIDLYREATARYLNLMLDIRGIRKRLQKAGCHFNVCPYESEESTGGISLFQLLVSTDTEVQDAYLNQRASLSASQLHQLCARTRERILVRCAGLVEVPELPALAVDSHESVGPYHLVYPLFIHRTALDFLTDSEDGQKILSHDPSTEDERIIQLIRGDLTRTRIVTGVRSSDNLVWNVLFLLSFVTTISAEKQRELLQITWEWYDRGHLQLDPPDNYRSLTPRPHFLAVTAAVGSPGFDDFIVSNVLREANPSLLATRILQDLDQDKLRTPVRGLPDRVRTIQFLLVDLNGNIEARAPWFGPHRGDDSQHKDPNELNPKRPFNHIAAVPFTSHLDRVLRGAVIWSGTPAPEWIRLIKEVLCRGCDLSRRVPLELRIPGHWTDELPAGHRRPLILLTEYPGSRLSVPLKLRVVNPTATHVVLDVNLAFLVKTICARMRRHPIIKTLGPSAAATAMISYLGEVAECADFVSVAEHKLGSGSKKGEWVPYGRARFILSPPVTKRPPCMLLDDDASERIIRLLEPWLLGDVSPERVRGIIGFFENLQQEIIHASGVVTREESLSEYLADEECGFRWVDKTEFNKLTQEQPGDRSW
ncbi:hypothetical protein QBC44DRAFT_379610 [Cladorrhinum sp. PSN332]|nr:hypothetical protein QBC44DRAFT_379610 [Cladorrhinum sp. PSN332]